MIVEATFIGILSTRPWTRISSLPIDSTNIYPSPDQASDTTDFTGDLREVHSSRNTVDTKDSNLYPTYDGPKIMKNRLFICVSRTETSTKAVPIFSQRTEGIDKIPERDNTSMSASRTVARLVRLTNTLATERLDYAVVREQKPGFMFLGSPTRAAYRLFPLQDTLRTAKSCLPALEYISSRQLQLL